MSQTSDDLKHNFIKGRLAILGIRVTTAQCKQFLELSHAHGWKFAAETPSEAMLEAAKGHTPEILWKQMWEQV